MHIFTLEFTTNLVYAIESLINLNSNTPEKSLNSSAVRNDIPTHNQAHHPQHSKYHDGRQKQFRVMQEGQGVVS